MHFPQPQVLNFFFEAIKSPRQAFEVVIIHLHEIVQSHLDRSRFVIEERF